MPWADRSLVHELEGGISVKLTQSVIVHDVPNFYFLSPLLPYKIRAFIF